VGVKIVSTKYPPRAVQADEMFQLLGVRRLPRDGMPERLIQGVRVYVKPLLPKIGWRASWQGLRVMAICTCGRHVPVGRLHQHKCKVEA
jgi:hypothetical protein